jgi:hypothetical protein
MALKGIVINARNFVITDEKIDWFCFKIERSTLESLNIVVTEVHVPKTLEFVQFEWDII